MTEEDIFIIQKLINKAVESKMYLVAHELKQAINELKSALNNDWVESIIKKINREEK